ncbi:hypothetical protein KBTX_00272 [wastewater metagenome]|uniref:AB hydrolase-1 domain-containing protein n=2 Tax=unclassified sequences TaxID=12908 RepID=A0A5B8R685_9ZZZZ|nr:hypothetical protein KBTEX_00272 [uncultured organism]
MLRIAREVLNDRGVALPVARPFHLHDHTTRLFDSGGDGPPLVLLHALSLDWRMWSRVIPLLTPRYRVIAYDLRGFGGLSLGGSIALELALRRPDLVTDLTVIAATAWPSPAFEERPRAAETAGMEA